MISLQNGRARTGLADSLSDLTQLHNYEPHKPHTFSMADDFVIERPLSPAENFFRSRTDLDFFRNFFVVGTYSRNLSESLPLLYRALRKIILDYHILICNVFKDPGAGHCFFRPIKCATLGDLVELDPALFCEKPVSEEFMNMLLRKKYFELYTEKPLFKLVFAGNDRLGVTFEHTIADGVVGPYFHEEFLKSLAYCDDDKNNIEYVNLYGPQPDSIDFSTPIFVYADDVKYVRHSLPPPMEVGMQDPSLDYTLGDPQHYSISVPESHPEKWPGRLPATKDFSVAFKIVNIPSRELKLILAKCKEHKVTLTSYITYVQALALQPIYGDKHHFPTVMAVTLRRFLLSKKISPEYKSVFEKDYKLMGNYAHMGLRESFAPAYRFSWKKVEQINANLAKTVTNDRLLNTLKPFLDAADNLSDNLELFTLGLGKNKLEGTKISNVGFVNFPVYEAGDRNWTVNDLVFGQDLAPGASEFALSVISTNFGGLNIVLSYYDQLFDDCEYDNFDWLVGRLQKLLLECAHT